MQLTILRYDDNAPRPPGGVSYSDLRFVAFEIEAEKSGFMPAFFTPFLLRLHDRWGFGYSPSATTDGFEFAIFWWGGKERGTVVFQIPRGSSPEDLIYQGGFGKIEFIFDDSR